MEKAIFLTLCALGDILCTTPVISAFRKLHPHTKIIYIAQSAGFTRVLEHNPDIDLTIYSDRLFINGIPDQVTPWLRTLPIDLRESATLYRLDLKFACTSEEAFRKHMSHSFAHLVGVEIDSVRPRLVLTESDRRSAAVFIERPYVVFSMHSVTNPERTDGRGKKKDWPEENWQELAARIAGKNNLDIFAVGAENDTPILVPHVRRLYGLPIRTVAALLERASCVVTLENGIAHLSAAVDAPMVEIYSNMMPLEWAYPAEATRCQVLYGDPFDISCDEVFQAVEATLSNNSAKK